MKTSSKMGFRKKRRLVVISAGLTVFVAAGLLVITGLDGENFSLYQQPTAILELKPAADKRIRLGGLVAMNSVKQLDDGVTTAFQVTDCKSNITVFHNASETNSLIPDLFREGQGVITEGFLKADGTFRSERVLAKHDETYMPREAAPAFSDLCEHPEGNSNDGNYRASTTYYDSESR